MVTAHNVPYDDEAYLHKQTLASRSSLSLSPDGQWIAVVVRGLTASNDAVAGAPEAEMLETIPQEIAGSEVLIVNTQTGQVERPFSGFDTSCWPAWSPDGKWLALLTQSGERRYPRLTLWSLDDNNPHGKTPRVFERARILPNTQFQTLRWTSDSRRIVTLIEQESVPAKPLVTRVDSSEPDVDKFPLKSLGVVDVESGQISAFGLLSWALGWRLSPDGQHIAFLCYTHLPDKPQNTQVNWRQLVVMSLADGAEQLIGEPQADNWGCSFNWSPDGCALAWLAVALGCPWKIFVAEVARESSLREIALPEDTSFGFFPHDWFPAPAPLWSHDSSVFYLPGQAKLWRFTRAGTIDEPIALPEGQGFEWCANSIAALDFPRTTSVHTTALEERGEVWLSRPHEVWKVDLTTQLVSPVWKKKPDTPSLSTYWIERAVDAARKMFYTVRDSGDGRLTLYGTDLTLGETHVVSTLFDGVGECEYGTIRSLSWTLPDGTECAGSLLLPVGWREGDKPPVVMIVYGDERGSGYSNPAAFHRTSVLDAHLLSANGYAVMMPDMPQNDEQPAASLVVAGEGAARALDESGLVDGKRIAVMGSSYGGYTTLCLLTGSKLFKAGVVSNGVYDLLRSATDTMLSWGWTETGQGRMHTSLWQNPTRYIDNSPLYALDKLEAPLIVLVGEADELSLQQSQALFTSLRRLGKRGEMLTYRDAGHDPTAWSIAAQRDWHRRLLAFLHEHLQETATTP